MRFGLPDVKIRLVYKIRTHIQNSLEWELIKLPVWESHGGISLVSTLSLPFL